MVNIDNRQRKERILFNEINTRKNTDDFEEKIIQIYKKYENMNIDKAYIELWNGFVDLIQYIQNQNSVSNMSPMEAIQLLKEIGLKNEDIKELFLAQMKEK